MQRGGELTHGEGGFGVRITLIGLRPLNVSGRLNKLVPTGCEARGQLAPTCECGASVLTNQWVGPHTLYQNDKPPQGGLIVLAERVGFEPT